MDADASGDTFQVKLAANPTTGYQWSLKHYDKKRFKIVSSEYIAPKTQLIGAGGQMVYTFKLQEGKSYPAKTKMLFTYGRSWEPKTSENTRVVINFKNVKK